TDREQDRVPGRALSKDDVAAAACGPNYSETPMLDVHELKAMLEHARRTVSFAGNRADIVIEQTADALDKTQSATQRDLAISLLNREATTPRQLERALQRIEEGTYGVCIACDKPISAKRLQVVPWAELCLRCQERRDEHQQRLGLVQDEADEYDGIP